MIIQVGSVQFDVDFGYETLELARRYNWGSVEVVGDHPNLQFTGKSMVLDFSGVRFEYGAFGDAVASLEELAERAEPVGVTDDQGSWYGYWVILEVTRLEDSFRRRQKTGIRTRWNLRMQFYADSSDGSSRAARLVNQVVNQGVRRFLGGLI